MKTTLIADAVATLTSLPALADQVPAGVFTLLMMEESAAATSSTTVPGLYTLDENGKFLVAGALSYELDDTGTITRRIWPIRKTSS